MPSGSFQIDPMRLNSISANFSAPPQPQLFSGTSGTIVNDSIGMPWDLFGDIIGSFTFATLPAGFAVVPGSVLWDYAVSWVAPSTAIVTDMNGNTSNTFPLGRSGLTISALAINTGNITLALADTPPGTIAIQYSTNDQPVRIVGSWTINSYSYSIDPPPGSEVEVGQQIVITSPGTDPDVDLNLNEVTLLLNDVPTEIDYQDEQTLIFTVPNIVGPMEIEVVGNGVQFSGSITLGILTVLLIAASGIYTLVPNKVNDTLYKSIRDGTTRDVKIPNPFAKTGFIGG